MSLKDIVMSYDPYLIIVLDPVSTEISWDYGTNIQLPLVYLIDSESTTVHILKDSAVLQYLRAGRYM